MGRPDTAGVTIGVLGPFRVDGDASLLEPRDRVLLEVLVLRPGDVVSAERLADAMWAGVPPPTWKKVVQNCVVRLRKVLGAGAIETSSAGYRLTTPADEVDAQRFVRMVRRSSELLVLGEHERAAYVSDEALALWRGPPLRELEGWEVGRIEAGRLTELRLDAEEIHLDAALRAGRHREVLGEAQVRVAEAPLRERRWALLALAQYQAGRQGDALRSLHTARRALVEELGVEPGLDLVALEQAILRQDPSLVVGAALPEVGATCPYLGLVPYGMEDTDGFFGRDGEVDACLSRLAAAGVLAVVGPSGSGKSSLVRAGVAAALHRNGSRVVVITPTAHPMDSLTGLPSGGPVPVLVVDQCEEAITLCEDPAEQARFFTALAAHAALGPLVIALRADRLGVLSAQPDVARLVESGLHLLSAMTAADLRAAIEGPARQAGLVLEPGLVDLLVREVEGEPGALPLLSHALHETWERREGRTLTVDGYKRTGGIRGSVAQSAEEVYDHVPEEQRPLLRDLLLRLVALTPEGEPVRSRVPRRTVATDAEHEELIELLVRARLVTSDDNTVELAHESLARAWPRLHGWLDDDVEGQLILRHLALAADTWDGMDRPHSELYRGLRLAQALDWQRRAKPDLSLAEREFLASSAAQKRAVTEADAQRVRHQARQNGRLRTLLLATAAALTIAVVAGGLAVVQSRRVADQRDQATAAARRSALDALASQVSSVRSTERSLAALLAVELERLDSRPASRSALFGTFTDDPGFERYVRLGDLVSGTVSVVVGSDDRRAMVAGHDGVVHVVDLERGLDTGERFPNPGFAEPSASRLALSSDGRLLAEISGVREDAGSGDNWMVLYDVASRTFRMPPRNLGSNVGDVAISPDGRWVVVAGGADGRTFVYAAATGVLVALIPGPHQSDSDAFNTAAVAFSPDGDLFVSYEGQRVRIFNPASGEQIGELPTASFQGAASPNHLAFTKDGQTLVGTTEHGQMAAWDVPSHALRWSSSDAGCLSIAIGPRSEGPLYCAGPADRVVPIDLASGQPSAPGFHTQQGAVLGLALTPDGRRLLFTSESRPLLGVWRLDGGGPIQRTIAAGAEPRAYRADGEVLLVHERLGEHEALWDPTTGTLVNPLDGVTDSLYFVGPDRLVAIWRDQAGVYDYRANEMVLFEGPDPVNAAPDLAGHRQLVWYGDGRHRFFDLITGQEVGPVLPLNRFTRAATFTADGRHLALSDLVDGVTIFEATTGEKVAGPEGGLAFTAITPEGLLIASTATGDLSFRDAATLEPRGPSLPAGSGLTNARLGLSADGSLLVASPSPSTPGQTRLFDVAGRTPLGGGIETVGSAALSPDGRELAVATTDGVALWDLNSAHWVEAACRIASRNMTRDEWSTYIGDLAPYRQTCPTRA